MNTEYKNAEEILDKKYIPGMHWKLVNRYKVLEAMEAYHAQFKQPDISEDVEKAAVEFKNLAKYSMDDKIGSAHWFRTLMSNVLHIGEYMKGNYPIHEPLQKGWGEKLYNISKDMLEWFGKVEPIPTVDEDELWNEVMLEAEASICYPDFTDRCKKQFSITRK